MTQVPLLAALRAADAPELAETLRELLPRTERGGMLLISDDLDVFFASTIRRDLVFYVQVIRANYPAVTISTESVSEQDFARRIERSHVGWNIWKNNFGVAADAQNQVVNPWAGDAAAYLSRGDVGSLLSTSPDERERVELGPVESEADQARVLEDAQARFGERLWAVFIEYPDTGEERRTLWERPTS